MKSQNNMFKLQLNEMITITFIVIASMHHLNLNEYEQQ